jgi:hypothetical protein
MQAATAVTTDDYVDVHVMDIRGRPESADQPFRNVVLLEEVDGTRVLPIWVGRFEGDSLVILLENVETMRPLTFSFAANVLAAAGGIVREVRVHRLDPEVEGGTFYAEVVIDGPAGEHLVDARPSDAICLALATHARLRVAAAVMGAAGRPREQVADVPDGTLNAVQGAAYLREKMEAQRVEWTAARKAETRPRFYT